MQYIHQKVCVSIKTTTATLTALSVRNSMKNETKKKHNEEMSILCMDYGVW